MTHRYRTPTGSYLMAFSMTAALALCAGIPSSAAAGRQDRFVETGQPRDLVNRPDCWIREHSEEWHRCAGMR
jgi:hypothetical protein